MLCGAEEPQVCRRTSQDSAFPDRGIWERTRQNHTQRRSTTLIREMQPYKQRGLFKCSALCSLHCAQLRTLTARPWPPPNPGSHCASLPRPQPHSFPFHSENTLVSHLCTPSLCLRCPSHGTCSFAWLTKKPALSLPPEPCFVFLHPTFHRHSLCVLSVFPPECEFYEGWTLAFCSQFYEQHQKLVPSAQQMLKNYLLKD